MSTLNLIQSTQPEFEQESDDSMTNGKPQQKAGNTEHYRIGSMLKVGQKLLVEIKSIDGERKIRRTMQENHKTAVSGLLKKIDTQKIQIQKLSEKIDRLSAVFNMDEMDTNSGEGINALNALSEEPKMPLIKIKRKFSLLAAEERQPAMQLQPTAGNFEDKIIVTETEAKSC